MQGARDERLLHAGRASQPATDPQHSDHDLADRRLPPQASPASADGPGSAVRPAKLCIYAIALNELKHVQHFMAASQVSSP